MFKNIPTNKLYLSSYYDSNGNTKRIVLIRTKLGFKDVFGDYYEILDSGFIKKVDDEIYLQNCYSIDLYLKYFWDIEKIDPHWILKLMNIEILKEQLLFITTHPKKELDAEYISMLLNYFIKTDQNDFQNHCQIKQKRL